MDFAEVLSRTNTKDYPVPSEKDLIQQLGEEVWANTRHRIGPKCRGEGNYRSYADFSLLKGCGLQNFNTPTTAQRNIQDLLTGITKEATLLCLSFMDEKCLVALAQTAKSTLRVISYVFPRLYHAWVQRESHAFVFGIFARASAKGLGQALSAKHYYGGFFVRPMRVATMVEGIVRREGWLGTTRDNPTVKEVHRKLALASIGHCLEVLRIYTSLPDLRRAVRKRFAAYHAMVRSLAIHSSSMWLLDTIATEFLCRQVVCGAALERSMLVSLKYHPRDAELYPSTPFYPESLPVQQSNSVHIDEMYKINWDKIVLTVELLTAKLAPCMPKQMLAPQETTADEQDD